MTVNKLTPVLFVDQIEPCVSFWVDRLGFEKTVEVPGENGLVFAIVNSGAIEVMYQTWASLEADEACAGMVSVLGKGQTFLFVEVADLDVTIKALAGVEIVMPVRTTFYGATEIGVKEPGGHFVTFAQFQQQNA